MKMGWSKDAEYVHLFLELCQHHEHWAAPTRRAGDLTAEVRVSIGDEVVEEREAFGNDVVVAGLGEAT